MNTNKEMRKEISCMMENELMISRRKIEVIIDKNEEKEEKEEEKEEKEEEKEENEENEEEKKE